ncbi:MAG: hypothetical protein VKM01_00065 [Cyanobacteriota bacterium]|nr:hypothetical protein [Cyanobacteriota bacterium]
MTRSRVIIDFGNGIRCSSDGGSIPSLSVSAGAYPDQWGVSINNQSHNNSSFSGNSSLMGLVTLHVPLQRKAESVDCETLMKESLLKARIENLRQLLEEEVISESQFREALRKVAGAIPKARPTTPVERPTLEIISTPHPVPPPPIPPTPIGSNRTRY